MRTFFYTITGRGPIAARDFIAQLTPDSKWAFNAVSRHGGAPLPCGGATVAEAAMLLGRTCRQILGESVTLKLEAPAAFYVSMRDEDGRWFARYSEYQFLCWESHWTEATAFPSRADAEVKRAITPEPEMGSRPRVWEGR